MNKKYLEVYTDGSYMDKNNKCSYGYTMIDKRTKEIKYKYYCSKDNKTELANIYSELKAVMMAVKFIAKLNIDTKIPIYYDCNAVTDLLTKNKQKYSKEYNGFIKSYKTFMEQYSHCYTLHKVKGHKNKGNIIVDKLVRFNIMKEQSIRGLIMSC